MTKKKVTLLCVGILWFSATAIASSAQEVEDTSDLAFSYLIDKYNLELVAEVPSGVSPIDVDTPENLERLLKELTTTISVETNLSSSESPHHDAIVYPFGVNQIMRTCNVDAGLIAWFQHDATFFLSGTVVTNVWSRASLQGVTASLTLTDVSTHWWRTNATGTSAAARAEGTINAYLLIQGGIRLFSQRVGCTINHS